MRKTKKRDYMILRFFKNPCFTAFMLGMFTDMFIISLIDGHYWKAAIAGIFCAWNVADLLREHNRVCKA